MTNKVQLLSRRNISFRAISSEALLPVAQNKAISDSPCVCTSLVPQSHGHLIMENEAILTSKALRVLTGSVSSETLAISHL